MVVPRPPLKAFPTPLNLPPTFGQPPKAASSPQLQPVSDLHMSAREHQRPELVSFDDIDYSDHRRVRQAQDSLIREQAIRIKALQVVRNALERCFETQVPNQIENCKDLAERYLDMLPSHEMRGYLAYQRNDYTK